MARATLPRFSLPSEPAPGAAPCRRAGRRRHRGWRLRDWCRGRAGGGVAQLPAVLGMFVGRRRAGDASERNDARPVAAAARARSCRRAPIRASGPGRHAGRSVGQQGHRHFGLVDGHARYGRRPAGCRQRPAFSRSAGTARGRVAIPRRPMRRAGEQAEGAPRDGQRSWVHLSGAVAARRSCKVSPPEASARRRRVKLGSRSIIAHLIGAPLPQGGLKPAYAGRSAPAETPVEHPLGQQAGAAEQAPATATGPTRAPAPH
jgi:hypothetical protein